MLVGLDTWDMLTARVRSPSVVMVILGITGTVGSFGIWMLRSAAILKVKSVDVVRQCWSKRTAVIKTEECCGHRWSAKC